MRLVVVYNIAVLVTAQLSLSAARRLLSHPKDCSRLAHNDDPVCGSDGKTYENDSAIRRINCLEKRSCADEITVVFEGPCDDAKLAARSKKFRHSSVWRQRENHRSPAGSRSNLRDVYLVYVTPDSKHSSYRQDRPYSKFYEQFQYEEPPKLDPTAFPKKKLNLFWKDKSSFPSLVHIKPKDRIRRINRGLKRSDSNPKNNTIKPLNAFWKNRSKFPSLVHIVPNDTLRYYTDSYRMGRSGDEGTALPGDCNWVHYNYDPICGSDGRTYDNVSILRQHNCNEQRTCDNEIAVAYEGACVKKRNVRSS